MNDSGHTFMFPSSNLQLEVTLLQMNGLHTIISSPLLWKHDAMHNSDRFCPVKLCSQSLRPQAEGMLQNLSSIFRQQRFQEAHEAHLAADFPD